ncbi:MAG: tetratricopeptide repeat protein, partial [Myxococcota bacterium]|nr:tetratricopeptide repeat protein [Myxococcota bacterium]
ETSDEKPAENQRKRAQSTDAETVAYLSAVLGNLFPSALVADMAGLDRESVDDLLDATEAIYEEREFSDKVGSWYYQFRSPLLRESILARHTEDSDRELMKKVAAFLERFVLPTGLAYLVRVLQIQSLRGGASPDAGEQARPRVERLRSLAVSSDRPESWAMAHESVQYFDNVEWTDNMQRTIYQQCLERMVLSSDVKRTESLQNEALAWATEKGDRNFEAWLLFAGSRLDLRRQDLYRARDRANDALKMYMALDMATACAEVRNHLGMIEATDGHMDAALEQVAQAEDLAPIPPIQARSHYVRGLVAKMSRDDAGRPDQLQSAEENFLKANELADKSGHAPLALEAGLNLGEVLVMSGQFARAADPVLPRVAQIAQALRAPVQERAALALLAQSHAATNNFEAALAASQRALQLVEKIKGMGHLATVDLFNMGYFLMRLSRTKEAVEVLQKAREGVHKVDPRLRREVFFHLGMALIQSGQDKDAEENLRAALSLAEEQADWPKVVQANDAVAALSLKRGDMQMARSALEKGIAAAEQADMKDAVKGLRKKLEKISD